MSLDSNIADSKILIVDDDASVGMMLEEILKEHRYAMVRYISDSRQAKTVFTEFKPDLVILDINMPHKDGFSVLGDLSELRKDVFVPVLMLTAEAEETLCVKALREGATDFLHKPMNVTEALVRIENMLKVRKLHKHLESQKEFLEDKVKDRTEQLKQAIREIETMHKSVKDAYIETIYRLTRATEYKDEETADHVKRLSLYSALMGRALGMNEAMVEQLLYASPMHDVGKIGIPDRILFKKSALDEEEWKIMRKHPLIGYEILGNSNAPILQLGAIIALNHHERWDGSGYPRGLKGEEIPVEARILALADVYDALRSKRHYKMPLDHDSACRIILEGDGRVMPQHFDPQLLEIFKDKHLEFKKIFDENNN